MKFNPSEPRAYSRRGVKQAGRWEIDLRGTLDNGLEVKRERRVYPASPSAGKIGKRQAAAMAFEEWQRWNRHGQVLRPGEKPALRRTGAMSPGKVPTLAQFAPDFLEFCASPNGGPRGANSPATLRSKETNLRVHLLPAFGTVPLDQITTVDVDRFVLEKSKAGYKPKSIMQMVIYLRRMLNVAQRFQLINHVPKIYAPPTPRGAVVALDADEQARFVETIRENYEEDRALLLELYLRAGLRAGEGLGLYPADIEHTPGGSAIHVRRSWGHTGYGPTKGRKARLVPLPPSMARRVDDHLARTGLSPRASRPMFPSDVLPGQPYTRGAVLNWVKAAGEAAGTQPLHTHMLRHTFGTECARRGVPLLTLKEWMGHTDVKTTMVYLHLGAPDHFRWAELLGD